jgi:hypothetical protein
VSALDVGSMIRASTSRLNVSSPTAPNPRRSYAPASTSHNSRLLIPATCAPAPAPELVLMLEVALREVRSNVSCPGRSRCRATSISTASWPSSCAEPMCSIPTTSRPCLCTIGTARAPEAVGTFRMNEATSEATNHPISHPEQPTTTISTQVTALQPTRRSRSGTSQVRNDCSTRHRS